MQTPSNSKPLKQSFGFKYAFVKFKLKTAMAISLHLKVTITFIHLNIWFKQSSKNIRGVSTSSYISERQAGKLQVCNHVQPKKTIWIILQSRWSKSHLYSSEPTTYG